MNEGKEGARTRRKHGRMGMAPLGAAIVLAGVVLIVGAVGYVALDAVGQSETSSSTVQSCTPSSAPECGHGNSTGEIVVLGGSAQSLGR